MFSKLEIQLWQEMLLYTVCTMPCVCWGGGSSGSSGSSGWVSSGWDTSALTCKTRHTTQLLHTPAGISASLGQVNHCTPIHLTLETLLNWYDLYTWVVCTP